MNKSMIKLAKNVDKVEKIVYNSEYIKANIVVCDFEKPINILNKKI